MDNNREISLLRGLRLVYSVFSYLQHEPFCCNCVSFMNSVDSAREKFIRLEREINGKPLPEEMRSLLAGIYEAMAYLEIPNNPVRQKKLGYCTLPKGICLAKSAISMYENMEDKMCDLLPRV